MYVTRNRYARVRKSARCSQKSWRSRSSQKIAPGGKCLHTYTGNLYFCRRRGWNCFIPLYCRLSVFVVAVHGCRSHLLRFFSRKYAFLHNFFFFFFFFPSPLLSSPFCYLSPVIIVTQIRNSDPWSYICSSFFSPLPTTVRTLHFCREKTTGLSSLVDSRRIVPTTTLGKLSSWSFCFFFFCASIHNLTAGGIQTPGPKLFSWHSRVTTIDRQPGHCQYDRHLLAYSSGLLNIKL